MDDETKQHMYDVRNLEAEFITFKTLLEDEELGIKVMELFYEGYNVFGISNYFLEEYEIHLTFHGILTYLCYKFHTNFKERYYGK